jgi:4-amino-4-deoxy-L-arabinose transferase-like glycosyltransferase
MIRTPSKVKATTRWLLVGLILLAFGRGIWALGGKSLWWDESLSLHRADRSLAYVVSNKIILTDTVDNVVTIDNHPPVYFAFLWAGVQLFGRSEFSLRFLSLASVVLMVPLLFATGRRLIGTRVGLMAAALGALSPMYLWYGQEARSYAMLTLWAFLSFYLFVLVSAVTWDRETLRHQWFSLAAYILVSTFVVFTHYLGSLLIAFELLIWGWMFLQRARHRRGLAPIIAVLLLVSLSSLVYAMLTFPEATSRVGFRFLPIFELLRDLLNSFSLGLSVDVGLWYVFVLDLIFLMIAIWGWWRLVRPGAPPRWRRSGWLLLGYLAIPIAVIYLMSYLQPAYMNSRHLMLITPAFYLLVASGLAAWRGRTVVIALLAGMLMLGGIGYSTYNYFENSTYNKDHHREWGEYLREHVRPGDVVVVSPPHIADLYQYYADGGVPWVGLPFLLNSREDTVEKLEELLVDYDRVWLALSHTPPWGDLRRFVDKWLTRNAFRTDYHSFKSYASIVRVAAFQRDWPSVEGLPEDAEPVEVRYSPALRLLGYRPITVARSGEPLHVELFWAVDEPIEQEASVALRLVDEKGHVWGQSEECPFSGLYPMWQWAVGLRLPSEHQLTISPGTPPGAYQLELVLVSRPTEDGCLGERGQPIVPMSADSDRLRGDRVLLGTSDVQRPESVPALDDLEIEERQRVRFDGLELLGSSLALSEPVAGGRLGVTLYWQLNGAASTDAQFRLRLMSPSGQIAQEKIIQPAGDIYPTGQWTVGDRFKGQFWLTVPEDGPGGRYSVDLVPEPPLRRTDILSDIGRRLGLDNSVRLGNIDVHADAAALSETPGAAIEIPTDLNLSHPQQATLGDNVRFLGFDMDSEAVQVGGEISFTLYWQALRPMEVSYTVFTHLVGHSNEILGQDDGLPQGGGYPTTLWKPGEVIADTYTIPIDPGTLPGSYPLKVGMYRLETGTRLPVTDADGQPLANDSIELLRFRVQAAVTPPPIVLDAHFRIFLPIVTRDR